MSMNTHEFYDCVSELIEDNEIDIKYIDDAVRRILKSKIQNRSFLTVKRQLTEAS